MRHVRVVAFTLLLLGCLQSTFASQLFVGSPGYLGIDIYDTDTSTKVSSLSTGSNTAYGLGFASTSALYVGSPSYLGFAVYNADSGLQTSFTNLPFSVAGVAAGSNGKVYVSSGGFTGIWIYDALTFAYLGQIASPNSYAALTFGPSGQLLAGSPGFSGFEIFDIGSNTKTGALDIPGVNVYAAAYDSESGDLYIGSPNFLGVEVYDAATMTKTGGIATGNSIYGLALRTGVIPSPSVPLLMLTGLGLIGLRLQRLRRQDHPHSARQHRLSSRSPFSCGMSPTS